VVGALRDAGQGGEPRDRQLRCFSQGLEVCEGTRSMYSEPFCQIRSCTVASASAGQRWLLIRRHQRTGELAFSRCWMPQPIPLATLPGPHRRTAVADRESFQAGNGLCGLDQHQVRRRRSWYRWTTLSMLALAFLMVLAATHRARQPTLTGLIGLTRSELQHLFAVLVAVGVADLGHRLRWSVWRRRHQARSRTCHYQRQATKQLGTSQTAGVLSRP
jgi:hypothetical protein